MQPFERTALNRNYLDQNLSIDRGPGLFAPVFGWGGAGQQAGQLEKIARTARILQLLAREGFESFLDVGAAEGYLADWVRELFRVPAAACDLSLEGCRNGRELLGVPTFSCTADCLPLADQAFDCVVCSEVIEHLADPMAAIAELMRVTRRVLVLTSREMGRYRLERWLRVKLRDLDKPHTELNWWHPGDFSRLMKSGAEFHPQFRCEDPPEDSAADKQRALAWLAWSLAPRNLEREGSGGIWIWRRPGVPEAPPSVPGGLKLEALGEALLAPRLLGRRVSAADEAWLLERLRSPHALAPLAVSGSGLVCQATGQAFPVRDGVPDLLWDRPRDGSVDQYLRPATARRLRALFKPENVWTRGWRRVWAQTLLGVVEAWRNRSLGRPWSVVWRDLRHSTRFLRRKLNRHREGWLLRAQGAPEIFKIVNGRRRHIVSLEVLLRLGYDNDEVVEVPEEILQQYPIGDPMS